MEVTDKQVATLHAQLAGRTDEHRRLLAQLNPAEDSTGYAALVAAAFFEAVDQRFAKDGKIADDQEVIAFVGSLRATNDAIADDLDPKFAERLILNALGKGSTADIPDRAVIETQILVLAGLIVETRPSEGDLASLLREARATANEWLAEE